MKPDTFARQCTTLGEFIAQAQPLAWDNRTDMLLEEWFKWPPDVFALTSLLLSCTGAYRRAAAPVKGQWPDSEWVQKAQRAAHEWRNWVADENTSTHPLQAYINGIHEFHSMHLDDLYDPEKRINDEAPAWELCKLLLELHAIADETMRGVGIVFSPSISLEGLSDNKDDTQLSENISFFYLQANFLLALRGSLTRLPKYRGIVLPKSRTPQIGLTLRSFSNNLTFHQTEVDVAWRAFPWLNSDENTINMMIVPWPFEVKANFFQPIYHPKARSQVGKDRYFHYRPDTEDGLDVEKIIKSLKATINDDVRRIHVMVFPEMALSPRDLRTLKRYLEAYLHPNQIPMIIAGVSAQFENEDREEHDTTMDTQTATNIKVGPHAAGFNRVVLSLYYAGKWHDVVQDKHHRWKIDNNQIEQYKLGGVLSGGRTWWEAIQITRRRLSVLAANAWLTICPLICEDLARLDPVSEVLRGVGPTLLTALLLDGPQIKERWSARYASVFADDPGSSVLTLTSLGMSERSIQPGVEDIEAQRRAHATTKTIALWKDQEKGWRSIAVEKSDFPAEVLTISAVWKSESTFDGRVDQENSAVFAYQGHFAAQPPGCDPLGESIGKMDIDLRDFFNETNPEMVRPKTEKKGDDAKRKKLKILDMCELTLFTYYTDAVVEPKARPAEFWQWFDAAIPTAWPSSTQRKPGTPLRLRREIADLLLYSVRTRDLVPREVPTPHLRFAIRCVGSIVLRAHRVFADYKPTEDPTSKEMLLPFLRILKETAWRQVVWYRDRMEVDLGPGSNNRFAKITAKLSNLYAARRHRIGSRSRTEGTIPDRERLAVDFSPHEIGRLKMMTPISILWAIHSRLTTMRRLGTLAPDGGSLLEDIENRVNGREFHKVYLNWRHLMKTAARDSAKQRLDPTASNASNASNAATD